MRLILVNPNTSAATTAAMVVIAEAAAAGRARIEGVTARFGAPLITTPAELAEAARAVEDLAPDLAADLAPDLAAGLAPADAVIVAAFGDPGLEALRSRLASPVTGIAEAGMAEAAAGGRRFAVVTTTPALKDAIAASAARHGHGGFLGTWTTTGDPAALTADPPALLAALEGACRRAVAEGGAEAVCIGGGQLAAAARALARCLAVPIVEPLPAAVRLALARAAGEVPPCP